MRGDQAKHSKQRERGYVDLSPCFLHGQEFLEIWLSSSSWYRQEDTLEMEIALVNVNGSYKRITLTQTSEHSCVCYFLKLISLKQSFC